MGRWGLFGFALAVVVASGACRDDAPAGGDGGEVEPMPCFSGDPNAAPAIAIVVRDTGGALVTVVDGDPVPLIAPPQGGQILLVGVRALNLDSCSSQLTAALVDVETAAVVGLESRPITLELAPDGWLQPKRPTQLSNYANVAACPVANLTRPIDGNAYRLQVSLEDSGGRRAEGSLTVVPTCGGDNLCRCLCATGYVLGQLCAESV